MAEAKYAEERRAELLRILASAGRIDAATVAAEFGVTSETVRKDLIALENTGLLRRVHGGAVPADSHLYEPTLEARIEFSAEKQRIAHKALEYIPNGGAALFDAGTTTHRLVQQLPHSANFTAYVNALPLATTLLRQPQVRVELVGGMMRAVTSAAVGDRTVRAFGGINVGVAFLGTNGIHPERGLTTPNPDEAAVKNAMLACAEQRIVLTDHSKFGLVRGVRHAELVDIDIIITDRDVPAEMHRELDAAGVELVIA